MMTYSMRFSQLEGNFKAKFNALNIWTLEKSKTTLAVTKTGPNDDQNYIQAFKIFEYFLLIDINETIDF